MVDRERETKSTNTRLHLLFAGLGMGATILEELVHRDVAHFSAGISTFAFTLNDAKRSTEKRE